MATFERKQAGPVLQREAGSGSDNSGAKSAEITLDQRSHISFAIYCRHVNGVSGAQLRQPRKLSGRYQCRSILHDLGQRD
jgi:hypothetical protein